MPTSICPECDEGVFVDAESEQGDVVTCDECGVQLVVVGLDPIELDPKDLDHDLEDTDDEADYGSFDYESDRF
ncbi:MAG: hypothetical protein WBD22_01355 [Pyrinomonadaceae bacterium]